MDNKDFQISREDLYQYYVVENHSRADSSKHFGISKYAFIKLLDEYNIKKAPEKVDVSREAFYNYFIEQNHTFDETAKYFNISKNQAVNLGRRYSIKKPSYLFSQHVSDMNRQRWANCSKDDKEAFKQKISDTKQAKSKEAKAAAAALGYETRRKNGTITTSKPEETTYAKLCSIFGESGVLRQYKSKRYPFHCDFYITALDLFLELNLHWAHGKHPFDKSDIDDCAQLAIWQSKADRGNNYYKRAVTTWTVRDPLKLKTAQANSLNYVVIYTVEELANYLNQLQQAVA